MALFPFVGGSYTARSKTLDSQRCVNLYVEQSEAGPGPSKAAIALIGTPGLVLWSAIGTGPIRGMIRFTSSLALVVSGGTIYSVTTAGVATALGAISGTGPVSMASNGTLVMVVTGPQGFFVNPTAGTVAPITDGDFTGADAVYFLDGYFVFNKPGTGQFQITQLYGADIDGLDFATAEGSPDNLVSLIVDHRELWLLGENSTEVWFNSGNVDFPFERNQGAFIEVGCAAKFSPAKLDNTVVWLTADDRGQGMVVRASGYQPQRISTHALEFALSTYSRIDDAVAYTYQQDGHAFYVLSFPTANKTWVYDAATGLWHERAWRNPADASLNRHRTWTQMAFANAVLVGDWESGNVYRFSLDAYTDNGDLIPRIRACSHIAADLKRQYFTAFQVDMEAGVGINTGQGSDPQAMLRWSDDGGYSWSNELWAGIGKLGEKLRRVRWRRLGFARDRVFELTITDPVRVAIVGASIDVSVES